MVFWSLLLKHFSQIISYLCLFLTVVVQVLQDQGCPPSHLEVRVQHRICPRLIKEADDVRALVMRIKVDNLTGAVRSVPVSGSVLAAAQCVYL